MPRESLKNVSVAGLQIVPGAPLPAGAKISPSGIQPDAYTPTVLILDFQDRAADRAEHLAGRGYVGLARLSRNVVAGCQHPVADYLPGLTLPLVTGRRDDLLSDGRAARESRSWPTPPPGCPKVSARTTRCEVDLNHRFSHGFQMRGVYTFSKSLDDGTALNSSVGANAPGFVMFPLNPKLGLGTFHHGRAQLAVHQRDLRASDRARKGAIGNAGRWAQKLASGWTFSGIETVQSGFPFTPQLGFNPANNGDSRDPVRPSWNPAFTRPVILGGPNQYFNPNAFIAARYGNIRKRGPRHAVSGRELAEAGFVGVEEHAHVGEGATAVPRGVLQYSESRQFRRRRTPWCFRRRLPRRRPPPA